MNKRGTIAALLILAIVSATRAAGPFGSDQSGLPMTSAVFRAWVSRVIEAKQLSVNSGGFANDDDFNPADSSAVIGKPVDELMNNAHVYSLGNGGSITVTFDEAITDSDGPDFAIFENGFNDWSHPGGGTNGYTFSELAYVEVATTTNAWAKFPSQYLGTNIVYNLNLTASNRWASQDVTLTDGLAGKHICEQGTPFDLSALRSLSNVTNGTVDLRTIRYIRLTDVVGDGSRLDSSNRPIFDPYYNVSTGYPNPTSESANDGFDLRAIGLINSGAVSVQPSALQSALKITWFATTNNVWQPQSATNPAGPWTAFGAAITGRESSVTITSAPSASPGFYRLQRWSAP